MAAGGAGFLVVFSLFMPGVAVLLASFLVIVLIVADAVVDDDAFGAVYAVLLFF